MEISTSTNICAFTPGRERNGFDFCIAQCAQGGYKVLDINFCESMNPHSRMRNDDWQDYVKDIAEMGRRWGVVFRQSHLLCRLIGCRCGSALFRHRLILRIPLAARKIAILYNNRCCPMPFAVLFPASDIQPPDYRKHSTLFHVFFCELCHSSPCNSVDKISFLLSIPLKSAIDRQCICRVLLRIL